MKSALKKHENIEVELSGLHEKKARLEVKNTEIAVQRASLDKKIDQGVQRFEESLTANILGELPDSELEKIRFENSGLESESENLDEKVRTIEAALRNIEQLEQNLIESRNLARTKFLQAAVRDLSAKIGEEVKDHVAEVWAVASRMGANYNTLLQELFPREDLEKIGERWNRFVEIHKIEH